MWEWHSSVFRTRQLIEEPSLAAFATGLIATPSGEIDINRSVLSRYRMRALPLVEWDGSPDAPALFETLRGAGVTRGYFIDYPGQVELGSAFRECDLTPATAAVIRDEGLFGWSTVFVDETLSAVVAAWFTDLTYWCMAPALYDEYLTANPMRFAIDGDEAELPADKFQTALKGAFRRLEDWSPSTSYVRDALEWQLIRET